MSWRFAARLAPRGAAFFNTCSSKPAFSCTAAALVGLGVAIGLLQLIAFYGADYIPRIDEIRLFGPALLWLAGLALASAVMIGLVPACTAPAFAPTPRSGRVGGRRPTARRRDACSACSSPPSSRSRRRCSSRRRWCSSASIA